MTLEEAEKEMVKTVRKLQRNGFRLPPRIWVYDTRSQKSATIDPLHCRDDIDKEKP